MKDDAQMFLLGAVLLSSVFMATAALQTSTVYSVQAATVHEAVDYEWLSLASSFSTQVDSACGPLPPLLQPGCVDTTAQYWKHHMDAGTLVTCSADVLRIELETRRAHMVYEVDYPGALDLC